MVDITKKIIFIFYEQSKIGLIYICWTYWHVIVFNKKLNILKQTPMLEIKFANLFFFNFY